MARAPLARPFRAATRVVLALATLLSAGSSAVFAQTGVSDDRVSLPDGPGSLEGVGDNAAPDPNMGLMHYTLPLELPEGFAGATPALALDYSSGAGNGVAGIGWTLDVPFLERMTLRGLPRYDADDEMGANGSDPLVRVDDGEPALYRARFERGFVRYAWHDRGDGAGGYWTAERPDGAVEYYGADASGTLVPHARLGGPEGVFRYLLVERVDVFGHRLVFTYGRHGGTALVERIEYVFGDDGQARHLVTFTYAPREDVVSDGRAGFEERLAHRLTGVAIAVNGEELRRYALTYEPYDDAGGFSRLARVEQFGVGGARHPAVFELRYSRSLGARCNTADCEGPYLETLGSLGVDLSVGNATLVDLDGDALPDIVDTTGDGAHRLFMNRLEDDGSGYLRHRFAPAVPSANGTGASHRLSSPHVQVLDLDGDGFADLLNRQTGRVLPNTGTGDWGAPYTLGGDAATDLPDFGEDFEVGGDDLAHVRFFDYDGDRRIDVIRSQEDTTAIYENLGAGGFAAVPGVSAIGAGFADTALRLEDMNGDGLLDPVILRAGELSFKLDLGRGRWSADWTTLPVDVSDAELAFADLVDLNGDSLSDVVVVVGDELRYALNRSAMAFDAPVTVDGASGQALPQRTGETTVLFADMNGNGSEDVVWVDPSGQITMLELFPVRPNLLARLENGLGMVTEVVYGTSVEHLARDGGAQVWAYRLPHPMVVVDSLDTYEQLGGVHSLTRYRYHDGFYDGLEKRFRGFARVEVEAVGDAHQQSALSLRHYDVGATDPYRAGLLLDQAVLGWSDGAWSPLTETATEYADCPLEGVPPAGLVEPVRSLCPTATETTVQEGRPAAEWITTRTEATYDRFGNVTLLAELGVTAIGGAGCPACEGSSDEHGASCGPTCDRDERYTETDYVPPSATGGRWILGLPYRARTGARPESDVYTETLTYYDGLPLGELSRGLATRVTARVDPDSDGVIDVARTRYDRHGNPIDELDPEGEPGGTTHRRLITWDDDGLLVEQVDTLLEDAGGAPYRLRLRVDNDPLFGQPVWFSGPLLVVGGAEVSEPTPTQFAYDAFGRLVARTEAGDDTASPTQSWTWELGTPAACPDGSGICPVNRVVHRLRTRAGSDEAELERVRCFDGLGRLTQERIRIEPGRYQVNGLTIFNRRGQQRAVYAPWESGSGACDPAPPDDVEAYEITFDALGREVRLTYPDAGLYGTPSERRNEYGPLQVRSFDEEDTDPRSPHADTPTLTELDGLGRTTALTEYLSGAEPATYRYRYDALGHLATLTDPEGNVASYLSDLLGRAVRIDDPDRGTIEIAWDRNGNRIAETDARGVTVRSAYDGADRLVATWDDADPEATRVTWTYDRSVACPQTLCTNLPGLLAEIAYPLNDARGAVWLGYDARRHQTVATRLIGDLRLALRTEHDNAGRVVAQRYPAGRRFDFVLDGADRLTAVTGFIDALDYDERGNLVAMAFANGVTTELGFDARQRLAALTTELPGGASLLDHQLTRDRAGNLLRVDDGRPDDGFPHGEAVYTYDSLYGLVDAQLEPSRPALSESLTFDLDAARDLVAQTSSRGLASRAHLGELTYGAAGAHAPTLVGDSPRIYDASGRLRERGDETFEWDAWGRLTSVRRGEDPVATFTYGGGFERVEKREGSRLTHYVFPGYELRDGITSLDLIVGDQRVARLEADDLAAELLSDLAPARPSSRGLTPEPDGRITAADAWLAAASSSGELAVDAARVSEARLLLASSAHRRLLDGVARVTFLHRDQLGSLVAETDADGAVTEQFAYYPHGDLRASATGDLPRYGFGGRELDESTGLYHLGARLYDPTIGRFISPDPAFAVPSADTLERPAEAANPYLYGLGNPVTFIDPDGRFAAETIVAVWAVTAVGTGVTMALGEYALGRQQGLSRTRSGLYAAGAFFGGLVLGAVTPPVGPLIAAITQGVRYLSQVLGLGEMGKATTETVVAIGETSVAITELSTKLDALTQQTSATLGRVDHTLRRAEAALDRTATTGAMATNAMRPDWHHIAREAASRGLGEQGRRAQTLVDRTLDVAEGALDRVAGGGGEREQRPRQVRRRRVRRHRRGGSRP